MAHDIVLIVLICALCVFFGWIIFELSNQIEFWKRKYNILTVQIRGRDESILRLDDLLIESLNGQLELIKYLENFKNFMSERNQEVLQDWKMKITRTKEIHVERWREWDEVKVNPQNVDGKLGEETK